MSKKFRRKSTDWLGNLVVGLGVILVMLIMYFLIIHPEKTYNALNNLFSIDDDPTLAFDATPLQTPIQDFWFYYGGYVALAGIILATILVILWGKNEVLKEIFITKYDCEDGLSKVKVKRKLFSDENGYELNFPYWEHGKQNGERDLRFKNNYVKFPKCFVFVDHYKLVTKDPILAWDIVNHLRSLGIKIPLQPFEEYHLEDAKAEAEFLNGVKSIESLIRRFENKPTDFEEYVCSIFRKQGWIAKTTPPTNDGGYDFVLKDKRTAELVAIGECKLYSPDNVVGRPLIQKLVGANATVNADNMIFVTTSSYSREAQFYAKMAIVELIDGFELLEMAQSLDGEKEETKTTNSNIANIELKVSQFPIPRDILEEYYSKYLYD